MSHLITTDKRDVLQQLEGLVCQIQAELPFHVTNLVNISAATEEKGLIASKNISKDELIFSIQSKCFIHQDNINSTIASAIEESITQFPDTDLHLLKMIVALYECKLASKKQEISSSVLTEFEIIQATYYETLPNDFSHMPLNFNSEDLESFGPSFPLNKLVGNLKKQCQQAFLILNQIINDQTLFDLEFVNWAVCCLNSRSFELKEKKTRKCLVPFADLINHSFESNVSHQINEEIGILSFIASRDIMKNEELTICYQAMNDSCSFLLHYGFSPWNLNRQNDNDGDSNRNNEIQVYFRASFEIEELEDESSFLKQAILSLGSSPSPDMALAATMSQPLPSLWIWLLRLKEMTIEQRTSFVNGQVQLTMDVELKAWESIKTSLNDQLSWYENRSHILNDDGVVTGVAIENIGENLGTAASLSQTIREHSIQVIKAALTEASILSPKA